MDIKTAARTLDVFEAFAAQARPLRLSELATLLDAPVSSCFQLIGTLRRRGYVYALQDKSYYPTKRMLETATSIAAKDPVLSVLHPLLENLRDRTGESVLLGQPSEQNVMLLDVVESANSVRYSARPGSLRHLHSSSVGKALLGEMSRDERDRALPSGPLPRFTPATITARAALEADLERSKARGYYVSQGETDVDLHSVAVPFRFAGSLFAVSIAGPVSRFKPRHKEHAAALLALVESLDRRREDAA